MQEMYQMSINIHYIGVLALIAVVLLNIVILKMSQDIVAYSTKMRPLMPISSSLLALILFTGAVMMAAKHLDFTLQNVVMILFALLYVGLDIYRYKLLKSSARDGFKMYRTATYRIFTIELISLLLIVAWMVL